MRRARELGADVLVTTGGASVGDHDLIRPALSAEGMAMSFWKVALRPGKPLMHGRLGAVAGARPARKSRLVLRVCLSVPDSRCCAACRAESDLAPSTESAALGCDLRANDERADYLRAILTICRR